MGDTFEWLRDTAAYYQKIAEKQAKRIEELEAIIERVRALPDQMRHKEPLPIAPDESIHAQGYDAGMDKAANMIEAVLKGEGDA